MLFVTSFIVINLISFLAAQLASTPWPMFGQSQDHNAQSLVKAADNNVTIWKYEIGHSILSSPVIGADGTIYVGSTWDHFVYAINPNGTLKWKFETGMYVQSTCAIGEDNTIYVGSLDGYVYALDGWNGDLKWRTGLNGLIYSSPVISNDGTIFIGSYDKHLYALDEHDGSVKWKYLVGSPILSGNPVYSSPALSNDGSVFFGKGDNDDGSYEGTGNVYGLTKNGELLWNFTAGYAVFASPSVRDDTVFIGCYDVADDGHTFGSLYAFDILTGDVKWRYKVADWITTTPAINSNGDLFFGSDDGFLYSLNSQDGSLIWKFDNHGSYWRSSPAIGADGTVIAGSNDCNVYALDGKDGSVKWQYHTEGTVESSPAIGKHGNIVFGSSDGYVYNIGLTPAYAEEILDSAKRDVEDLLVDKAIQKLDFLCSLSSQLTKVDFANDVAAHVLKACEISTFLSTRL